MVHRNSTCRYGNASRPAHATGERTRPRVLPTGALAGWRCASDSTKQCRYFSNASRAVLGLGLVEYSKPRFSPVPGKSQAGQCAIARRGATSFCFLPSSEKMVGKKQHLFRA